ncbi:MAG: branched-chain amino acid ABC transporter permease [Deltaproteobacteria bacterium]|nr:branched-chain amino acid ABC transporter permease [Deltaproteobacteria bacterium]
MMLQFLVNATTLGAFYALVAIGFSLILGVTHAFNLAHGEMLLLSGYLAYFLGKHFGAPLLLILPVSMLTMLFAALCLERLLRRVPEPHELNTLVITFGLVLLLQNAMLMAFSANYRIVAPETGPGQTPSSTLFLSETQVLILGLSLAATGAVFLLLKRSFLGKALRATIQDGEAARLAGINVKHMHLLAFGLGGLLVGTAGPLYARTAYLHPFGGMEATLIAVILTIFAGVGRIRGLLIGGWILGLVESGTVLLLGTNWRELASSLILIALLLLRPEGLLPKWAKTRP